MKTIQDARNVVRRVNDLEKRQKCLEYVLVDDKMSLSKMLYQLETTGLEKEAHAITRELVIAVLNTAITKDEMFIKSMGVELT